MGFKLNKSNISINIQPVAKPRMTRSDRWKKRPVVLKYWQFKDALKEKAEQKNWNLSKDITIYFSIAMPKSWSKKKEKTNEQATTPTKTRHRQFNKICIR